MWDARIPVRVETAFLTAERSYIVEKPADRQPLARFVTQKEHPGTEQSAPWSEPPGVTQFRSAHFARKELQSGTKKGRVVQSGISAPGRRTNEGV